MIKSLYNKNDKRYIFFTGEELASSKKQANLEDYLNLVPNYMWLPAFRGVPKPEVFLHKFKNQQGKVIYYCHSGLWKTVADWCKKNNIVFEVARLEELPQIYELYSSRTIWFKENNINQWSRYLIRHQKEFPVAIENQNYYILKKNNEIIAGFELSNNPGHFEDNGESIYLNNSV